jgi:hypothetical protein
MDFGPRHQRKALGPPGGTLIHSTAILQFVSFLPPSSKLVHLDALLGVLFGSTLICGLKQIYETQVEIHDGDLVGHWEYS